MTDDGQIRRHRRVTREAAFSGAAGRLFGSAASESEKAGAESPLRRGCLPGMGPPSNRGARGQNKVEHASHR